MIEITLTIPAWLSHVMYWAFAALCVSAAWWCLTTGAFALWLWASEWSVHKTLSKTDGEGQRQAHGEHSPDCETVKLASEATNKWWPVCDCHLSEKNT